MLRALNHRRLAVIAEDLLHGGADLAYRRVGPYGFQDRVHRVFVAGAGFLQLLEPFIHEIVVPVLLQFLEAFELAFGDLGVDAVELHVLLVLGLVDVDVDHVALLLFQLALVAGRGFGDFAHREALFDGRYHAPHLVNLVEILVGLPLELVGQGLDEVGAAERVYGVRYTGLQGCYLLRPDGDAHRFFCRQRERLVERVGVQALGAAEDGRQSLEGGAGDVVVRLLRGQGDACGLGVEAHPPRSLVLRAVFLLEDRGPDAAGGAELADLLEEVYVRVEEEGEARGEVVHVEAGFYTGVDVREAVRQREG